MLIIDGDRQLINWLMRGDIGGNGDSVGAWVQVMRDLTVDCRIQKLIGLTARAFIQIPMRQRQAAGSAAVKRERCLKVTMSEALVAEREGLLAVQGNRVMRWHVEGVDGKVLVQHCDLMPMPAQCGAYPDDRAYRRQQAFIRHGTPPCGQSARR